MSHEAIHKTLVFKNPIHKIVVEVVFDNGRLSLTGTHSQKSGKPGSTYRAHSWGQIEKDLIECFGEDEKARNVYHVWKRWHLNDMRAGTPAQESFLRAQKPAPRTYSEILGLLYSNGLMVDNGYSYGSAWLKEEVPSEVIERIQGW